MYAGLVLQGHNKKNYVRQVKTQTEYAVYSSGQANSVLFWNK